VTTPTLFSGANVVTVIATDAAGNASDPDTITVTYNVGTAPTAPTNLVVRQQ
jgi:hypothetical protein